MTDERKVYINQFGTIMLLTPEQSKPYIAAGYRPLRTGEIPPLQAVESVSGAAPAGVDPPSPDAIKRIRRSQAKEDGA